MPLPCAAALHFEHQDIRSLCEALGRYELIPYELAGRRRTATRSVSPSTRNHFVENRNKAWAAGLQIQIQADGILYLRKPFPRTGAMPLVEARSRREPTMSEWHASVADKPGNRNSESTC